MDTIPHFIDLHFTFALQSSSEQSGDDPNETSRDRAENTELGLR